MTSFVVGERIRVDGPQEQNLAISVMVSKSIDRMDMERGPGRKKSEDDAILGTGTRLCAGLEPKLAPNGPGTDF